MRHIGDPDALPALSAHYGAGLMAHGPDTSMGRISGDITGSGTGRRWRIAELVGLDALPFPCLIWDLDSLTLRWANAEALRFHGQPDLGSLLIEAQVEGLAEGARDRLLAWRPRIARGDMLQESWIARSGDRRLLIPATVSRIAIDGTRLAALVVARPEAAATLGGAIDMAEILRAIPTPVLVVTGEGRVLMQNNAAEAFHDAAAHGGEDRSGLHGDLFARFAEPREGSALLARAHAVGTAQAICTLLTASGRREHRLAVSRLPGSTPEEPMFIVVAADVTEIGALLEALRASLEATSDRLRRRDRLLRAVAHEMRTPLNAVLGFAEVLAADLALLPSRREQLMAIRDGGARLLALVERGLEIADGSSGLADADEATLALHLDCPGGRLPVLDDHLSRQPPLRAAGAL